MRERIVTEDWLRPDIKKIPTQILLKMNEFDFFIVTAIIASGAIKPNRRNPPGYHIRRIAKHCGLDSNMAGANIKAPGLVVLGIYELFNFLAIQVYFMSRLIGLENADHRIDSLQYRNLFLSSLVSIIAPTLLFTDLPFMSLRGPIAIMLMGVSRALRYPAFMMHKNFDKKSLLASDIENGNQEEAEELIDDTKTKEQQSASSNTPQHELVIRNEQGEETCKISVGPLVNCAHHISKNSLHSDLLVSYAKLRPLLFLTLVPMGSFIISMHLNPFNLHHHTNKHCLHSKRRLNGRGGMLLISPPIIAFGICEMLYAILVLKQLHSSSTETESPFKLVNKDKLLPLFASGGMSLLGTTFLLTDPRIVSNARLGVIGLFLIGLSSLLGHPAVRIPEHIKSVAHSTTEDATTANNQSSTFSVSLRKRGSAQADSSAEESEKAPEQEQGPSTGP